MTRAWAAAPLLLVPVLAAPPSAASERMQLHCDDGRVIERTNGSSWWGLDDDAGYVTQHLLVTADGEVQYEKRYGSKAGGERSTCVAAHFGTVWTVDLVRTR